MPKNITTIFLALLFFVSFVSVNAQESDSAFAELSGKEKQVNVKDSTVTEYNKSLDDYDGLLNEYQKAFGEQKEEAEEKVIQKGKQILAIKVGVVQSRLNVFETEFTKMEFSEEDINEVKTIVGEYKEYAEEVEEDINETESLTALTTLSGEINTELVSTLNSIDIYSAKFSIEKGIEVIETLKPYTELIDQHINSASEAGAPLDETKEKYSEALTSLNEADAKYKFLRDQIVDEGYTEDISTQIDELMTQVKSDYITIGDTVQVLKFRYGETPWSLE